MTREKTFKFLCHKQKHTILVAKYTLDGPHGNSMKIHFAPARQKVNYSTKQLSDVENKIFDVQVGFSRCAVIPGCQITAPLPRALESATSPEPN